MSIFKLLAGLVIFTVTAAQPETGSCSSPDTQVLILGGGMAGIAAANRLHELGINDFMVLEATSKLGGRMRAKEVVPGVNIGFGAKWIEGIDRAAPELHPLYKLAQQCGGLEGIYSDFESFLIYNNSGADITNNAEFATRYNDYYSAVAASQSLSITRQANGLPDISVRDALTRGNWTALTPVDNFIEFFEFWSAFAESPDVSSLYQSIDLPTAHDFLQDENNYFSYYYVTDQRGYSYLVDCLANNFSTGASDDRIHLNTTVNQISYNEDCVCVDVMENGNEKQYCGSYSIVTFSIGVLQSGMQPNGPILFSPALSMAKVEAINSINMATLLYVYLVFEERFWDDVEYIGFASTVRGYYPVFQPLQRFLPNETNIIGVWATDDMAERIVQQDIAVTTQELMEVLRTIYGNISEPIKVVFNNWLEDPLFLGTYSHRPVGVTNETIKELITPEGRLYISGEATSEKYYGYVHGAQFSGIDTANLVGDKIESSGVSSVGSMMLIVASLVIVMNIL